MGEGGVDGDEERKADVSVGATCAVRNGEKKKKLK